MSITKASGHHSQRTSGPGCSDVSATGPMARSDQARRHPKTGVKLALSAVLVVVLGYASLEPAYAGECSRREAAKTAIDQYGGGKALSVTKEGDYLIVRLRLPDGYVVDVAIYRWGC